MKEDFDSAQRFEALVSSLSQKGNIYIAGAGNYGKVLGQYFDRQGIAWEGYADIRASLEKINGKEVRPYDGLDVDGYYVVSSYNYKNAITKELIHAGISPERIFCYDNPEIIYELYSCMNEGDKCIRKLETFRGIHKNRRCFIIGNGPSLELRDLERLKEEISFASNAIYAVYEHTFWRPTYYCASDAIFCREMMSKREKLQRLAEGCEAVFTSWFSDAIKYRDDADFKKLYYMRLIRKIADNGLPFFSEDCAERVYTSGTIAYEMLQLAVYMGFQEIYLLGIDASYPVERHKDGTVDIRDIQAHQDTIEKEDLKFQQDEIEQRGYRALADIDLQLDGYKSARSYADTHGIRIYNATRGGKLEVFERVDFDSLFD